MRNRLSRSDWPAIVRARICLSQGTMIVGLAPAILCLAMVIVSSAVAQSAPISWNRPWHSSEEQQFVRDAAAVYVHERPDNPAKIYSLAELIDLAESNNPATRVAWERARAQAASLGVARSELYPTLAAAAFSRTLRDTIFFGSQFYWQRIQDFEAALDLSYTVLDFGARRGRINAARAQLLATNFEFNDTHRNVIYQVEQSYYRVLSSMGQEDAARASLSNAETVQEAAEDRLAHGLATLPDVLEARSATAQAEYDLQSVLGAEAIARGDLATAVGDRASLTITVQPLNQLPIPDSVSDTVDGAIDRALSQRPDLMRQLAEIRSANARVQEARSAYYPALSLDAGGPALRSAFGIQSPYDWAHTTGLTGALSFNLKWTINLRGVREAGLVFMLPTYVFVGSLGVLIIVGLLKTWSHGGHPVPMAPIPRPEPAVAAVSAWLLVKAFSSGCTAMTGVEAVSNGVPAFREPKVKNAQATLTIVIATLILLFAGIAYLCRAYDIAATPPGLPGYQSVLSQLALAVTGRGVFYFITMAAVLTVLALSANTSFADFPRLCRSIAEDRWLPYPFTIRGRRLVYSFGVYVLAFLAAALLIAFEGVTV